MIILDCAFHHLLYMIENIHQIYKKTRIAEPKTKDSGTTQKFKTFLRFFTYENFSLQSVTFAANKYLMA